MKVKKGYKQTEIGIIPEDWEVVKLKNILTIKYGKSQKNIENSNGKYPILGTGGLMGYTNSYLYDKASVLIGRKGTIDKPQYINKPFWTVDTLFYTDIKIKSFPKWVYYRFLTIPWKKYNEASGVPSLSVQNIHNIKIPLPPQPEQKKIAKILSTVDKKIALIDNQIEETETLKKGLMQKLLTEGIGHSEFKDSDVGRIPVGWGVVKLEKLATKISDGIHMTPKYVDNSQYNFINGNNLSNGEITFNENTKSVSEEEYLKYKKDLNDNTVLLSINGTIGNVAYYNNEEIVLGKSAAYIICTDKLNKFYLGSLLKSFLIKRYFDLELTGTTIRNLSIKSIKNIKVPLPPLKEQKQIAKILSTTDEKLEILREKKEYFQKLKKGLMQKLLTGEIRVKV